MVLACCVLQEKYGILHEDMYNFDETGFMMGVISSQMIVSSSEEPGERKRVQPGNGEWVAVIQGVKATGWACAYVSGHELCPHLVAPRNDRPALSNLVSLCFLAFPARGTPYPNTTSFA